MSPTFNLVRQLQDIDADGWNSLAGDHPLVNHAFLLTLQETGCAAPETGWAPHFLLMHRNGQLAAAMPLYLKSHSRGEYVFDHAWAHAFARHGLAYYPKLLSAIPFTPVPGPRLLARNHADRVLLAQEAIAISRDNQVSSVHVLFPDADDERALVEAGFMLRENVQFHWFNDGYSSYEDFLASLSQQKRKKIKQDSRKVEQAGVRFRWLEGEDIDSKTLRYFYTCYERTYMEHGNAPYLSYAFFETLHQRMPQSMMMVVAEQDGAPVAAALNIRATKRLYGRYWGCTRYIPGLHFEACYIQGIAYCIARNLSVFEGGAQGEHKLSRGMLPVRTCSAHWIADQRYAEAIMEFLEVETTAVDAYLKELQAHSPFKSKPE
ncbi:GNAT family N-acetyltransferase [Pollutimonas thiosulfatoxidans]|uniref:GNAT family N-acetyltransferase n=1 Tax=Pollutimonas thiosulfatoxidans TaxID=2028345 RepID=A0A410GBX9_9BURK|nr:GNAT family N-acetyltransferase [Pollutimonas thiosulfatoxidans]MBF6616190.1 N-acetyltransferase [Candidimonas sp.]NYT44696.1 N-acetyltransferase [Alcaligenaceae bacterium]QAA93788.1 GNAT family N-acetyltransferase [Pollutimonas thiosulfatoxidans]